MSAVTFLPTREVLRFLEDYPVELAEIVLASRDLVLEHAPHATESLLWGGISYHDASLGGRVKGAICGIGIRRDEVTLAFIHGASLPDPHGLLHGDRKSKRELTLASVKDLANPAIGDLIDAAAEFVQLLSRSHRR